MRFFIFILLFSLPNVLLAQQTDTLSEPIIPDEKVDLLKNVNMSFGMRAGFRGYTLRGGEHDYQGAQFVNGYSALGISAKLHDKVNFHFRNRFNKESEVQSLDELGNSIELAFVDIQASPKLNIQIGRQDAYFGGFEYSFSAMDIMEYNDIQSNALAYVTGVGLNYQVSKNHDFGFQLLNSRTMHYDDVYGHIEDDEVQEPNWPVEFVGNWRGSFFDGKFETIYSYSYSEQVKNKGTHFITLGHKYQNKGLTLMYDFDYSLEEVDTKGLATNIILELEDEKNHVAQDVNYIENWFRGEYEFNSKFTGLLSLMTSSAYGKDIFGSDIKTHHLRRSYGVIPTFYFSPFENLDIRFYITYIGRYYSYSTHAKNQFGATNYNENEFRIGLIAPLRLL